MIPSNHPRRPGESQRGVEEIGLPPEHDLPEDRDPSHYVRGAEAAAQLLGGVDRTWVQHLVRLKRLRSWPASALYGQAARSGSHSDRIYYVPELEELRKDLEEGRR